MTNSLVANTEIPPPRAVGTGAIRLRGIVTDDRRFDEDISRSIQSNSAPQRKVVTLCNVSGNRGIANLGCPTWS